MFGEVYVSCNRSIDSIIVGPLLPPIVRLTMVSATNCPASRTAGRRMDGAPHTAHLSEASHTTRTRRVVLQASRPRRGFRGGGTGPTRCGCQGWPHPPCAVTPPAGVCYPAATSAVEAQARDLAINRQGDKWPVEEGNFLHMPER